ncbi:MAG: hypothetical protein LBU88_00235 [Treponema sp.]|jgi:hypothetical protein|nr:hypothetical protein [Treponema sp.]
MHIEKETEKALLVNHNAVSFWIQRRWLKADGTFTKAGWKAYHIASRNHWEHFSFNAMKEFEYIQETEKAVLLRCAVKLPDGAEESQEFWLPKTMLRNWNFVSDKVKEIEAKFPFHGTYVKWSGRTTK